MATQPSAEIKRFQCLTLQAVALAVLVTLQLGALLSRIALEPQPGRGFALRGWSVYTDSNYSAGDTGPGSDPMELLANYARGVEREYGEFCRPRAYTYRPVGFPNCPHQFGNVMMQYLNDMAIAVITGRLIRMSKFDPIHCHTHLHPRTWMELATEQYPCGKLEILDELTTVYSLHWWPKASDAIRLKCGYANAGADADGYVRNATDTIHVPLDDATVQRCSTSWWYSTVVTCAHVGGIKAGGMNWYQAAVLASPGADISNQSAARAKVLFSRGLHFGFGALFRASFEFNGTTVIEPTRRVLDSATARFRATCNHSMIYRIAIHLRHQDEHDDGSDVQATWQLVEDLVNRQKARHRCFQLLVASDRRKSIMSLQRLCDNSEHDVQVVSNTANATLNLTEAGDSVAAEHGGFTGVMAIRDVYLLSEFANALIGTPVSSFSAMIGNLLATNPLNHNMSKVELRQIVFGVGENYIGPWAAEGTNRMIERHQCGDRPSEPDNV